MIKHICFVSFFPELQILKFYRMYMLSQCRAMPVLINDECAGLLITCFSNLLITRKRGTIKINVNVYHFGELASNNIQYKDSLFTALIGSQF